MNNILDKCIFIKCPLKDSCLRYGRKLREGQHPELTIFRYNNGCKNYFNKRHYVKQKYDMKPIINLMDKSINKLKNIL